MTSEDFGFTSATGLADLMRARELSPRELTDALLARIRMLDPSLRAFITVSEDEARQAAAASERRLTAGEPCGPLEGVPFSVKDLVFTQGVRTTGGSRVFEHFVPEADSIVVARLKRAGGILIGKTSTPEFGHKASTENLLVGDTGNPWMPERIAGGSSGGAAVAAATGLSPLNVGTDGGGSIRVPASCCGVFGFKPTFGRVPDRPGFGGGRTISHTGPITRSVRDAALMMDIIGLHDEGSRSSVALPPGGFVAALDAADGTLTDGLRIGFSADLGYAPVEPGVADVVARAVRALESPGRVVDTADPGFDDPVESFNLIIRAENYAVAAPLLERDAALLDPGMRTFTENGVHVTARDYLQAQAARDTLTQTLAAFFERYDVLITPTLAVSPFALHTRPARIAGQPVHGMGWNAFTYPFNLTGNPAASVPCGFTEDGLPVGLQVVAPRHADGRVLVVCAALERALPWAGRRPPEPGAD